MLDDHLAVAAHLRGPIQDRLEVQGRTVPPAVAFHAKHRPLGGPVLLQPLAGRLYLQEFGEAAESLEDGFGGAHIGEADRYLKRMSRKMLYFRIWI
jgi:hypothetical protein